MLTFGAIFTCMHLAREGGRGEERDRSPAEAQNLPLRRWRYDLLGFGSYHMLVRRGWGRGET